MSYTISTTAMAVDKSVVAAFHEGDDTSLASVIRPVYSRPGCAFVVGEKDRGIGVREGAET